MTDRSHTPVTVAATRIGRTNLGEATIAVEDGALWIAVRETAEPPLRIDLSTIEAVTVEGNEVTLPLRGGTRLTFECASPVEMRDALLGACRTLPELTSALRTLGSRRGNRSVRAVAPEEQRRFFAPMLRARREAGESLTAAATIAAFDASALVESTHRALKGFAEQRFAVVGPSRRALEAELFDANETLDAAYERLRDAGAAARTSVDDLSAWRTWAGMLRATFEAADRTWLLVDAVLEATPIPVDKANVKKAQQQTLKRP
ncbi:MAG: hypothetical protein ABI442_03585 [Gemmatimonadaceae bacterium]